MPDEPAPTAKPKFSAEIIKERLREASLFIEQAAAFAGELDWLGDVEKQPDGSDAQKLAHVRDEVDFALTRFVGTTCAMQRIRAESTRCLDLLVNASIERLGDGNDALHLMRRCHELFDDCSGPDGEVTPDTFPDSFVWDTYLRVSALAQLAEEFPKHIRHSARQMHGWPMIVSHHLDCAPEFRRIAAQVEVGADYPLNVGPRKKRGTETLLLRYLEPLIWRLHVLRGILIEAPAESDPQEPEAKRHWGPAPVPADDEGFIRRIYGFWWDFPDPKPKPAVIPILRRLVTLPPLKQKSAPEWSREVIVPMIMLDDAGTRESCEIPALCNIWRHRSVKSRATFQSRLHSAVMDTLQRFCRPG